MVRWRSEVVKWVLHVGTWWILERRLIFLNKAHQRLVEILRSGLGLQTMDVVMFDICLQGRIS